MPGHAGIIAREGVVMSWKGYGQCPTTLLTKVTQTCLIPHSKQSQLSHPGCQVPASSEGSVGSRD